MSTPDDFRRIEKTIELLEAHWREQPDLGALARNVGLSPFHFQRLFHRWAGVTPKRFLQFLTLGHAKARLRASATVLEASYEAGLSGPSRLHDLFVSIEAVTPGEFRAGGEGLLVRWGIHASRFGDCFVAVTERGVCGLGFIDTQASEQEMLSRLRTDWPEARIERNDRATRPWIERAFEGNPRGAGLSLFVRGTPFEVQVWRALLEVPPGSLTTYKAIATAIGKPSASRAVGRAVGQNPIAWLIPCHRVIRSLGSFGGYRWGPSRKKAILGWEAARSAGDDDDSLGRAANG